MNKLGIWAIAIAAAFVVGILTANPVVEAVGGWQGAFEGLDSRIIALENQPAQVYTISALSVIPAGETLGNIVQLRCLDGDRFLFVVPAAELSVDPTIIDTYQIRIRSATEDLVKANIPGIDTGNEILIGYDLRATNDGEKPPFEIEVTVTGVCLSPSP